MKFPIGMPGLSRIVDPLWIKIGRFRSCARSYSGKKYGSHKNMSCSTPRRCTPAAPWLAPYSSSSNARSSSRTGGRSTHRSRSVYPARCSPTHRL